MWKSNDNNFIRMVIKIRYLFNLKENLGKKIKISLRGVMELKITLT